jgi:hypothetical protein
MRGTAAGPPLKRERRPAGTRTPFESLNPSEREDTGLQSDRQAARVLAWVRSGVSVAGSAAIG